MKRTKIIIISGILTTFVLLICILTSVFVPRLSFKSLSNNTCEVEKAYGLSSSYKIKNYHKNDSLIGIGTRAFENKRVKEVLFEDNTNLKYIERRAFYGSNLQYIDIPNSVEYIYQNAFSYCSDLKEFNVSDDSKLVAISGSMFFDCESLEKVDVPSSCESIGSFAFYNCKNLKDIYLPSGITIYPNAFYGCDLTIHCSDCLNFNTGYDNKANIKIVNN